MNKEIKDLKKIGVKPKLSKKERDFYDPEFVTKVLAGVKAKENGEKGLRIDVDNLWK
ncbi:MAG: hypothetical protein JWR09_2251 [Mucilaginibacter sp.]|nr:hypothetical protein [Mucilaginibacter sp.]